MRVKQGLNGVFYLVFSDEDAAMEWEWLAQEYELPVACFDGYMNAFELE